VVEVETLLEALDVVAAAAAAVAVVVRELVVVF